MLSESIKRDLQRQADGMPCACGKRDRAEPQLSASTVKISCLDAMPGCVKACQLFECGVCHKSHKMSMVFSDIHHEDF